MFKGRCVESEIDTGIIEETGLFDTTFYTFTEVGLYQIKKGDTIHLQHTYESEGYEYNYFIYEANSNGVSLVQIGNYTTPDITYTLTHDDTDRIIFTANDNPSGTYKITYSLQITSYFIDNPIDAILNIKLLQNWSELGVIYNWGKEVVDEALIKDSGDGAFNSSTLADHRTLKVSRQIHTMDKAYSDIMVKDLCETFFLISYQDADGYECIKSLLTKETPATTITLSDVLGLGEMIPPDVSQIYCTPVINYAYDYALGEFTQQISINKTWETTYSSDYTSGLTSADSLTYWNACRSLWNDVKQIEQMPANLMNKYWIPDYATAVWYLSKLVQLMTIQRFSITVGYTTGYKWRVGTHFKIQVPHETNNNIIEVVIEKVRKNKKPINSRSEVVADVILLDEISTNIYNTYMYGVVEEEHGGLYEESTGGLFEE